MRTAKPRPGSRFRGRGVPAEGERACLGPYPGPWEKIPRTVTSCGALSIRRQAGWRRVLSILGASAGGVSFFFLRCHLQRNALPARSERTGRDNKERIS